MTKSTKTITNNRQPMECTNEWEYPETNSGLLFERCPVCNEYIYHRDKSKVKANFIKEVGYYTRTVTMQCICGQVVFYCG